MAKWRRNANGFGYILGLMRQIVSPMRRPRLSLNLGLIERAACSNKPIALANWKNDEAPAIIRRGMESDMDEVATKIIDILKKNMKEPSDSIALDTPLTDLDIESLDLAVIVFDIEDTFGIEIPYNANEEVEDFATVGSVVDKVKAIMAESKSSGAAA